MNQISFFGGADEIGGNKFLLELDGTNLFLDFGRSFSRFGNFYEEFLRPRSKLLLHDLLDLGLLPRKDGIYRKDALRPLEFESGVSTSRRTQTDAARQLWEHDIQSHEEAKNADDWHLDGLILSHPHMDHAANIPLLGPCPVLCTDATRTVLEATDDVGNQGGMEGEFFTLARQQTGQLGRTAYFPGTPKVSTSEETAEIPNRREHVDPTDEPAQIGSVSIEGVTIDHSVPGAMATLINSNDYQILYTGDLRFHGRTGVDLRTELEGLEPDLMLCEGTRMDRYAHYGEADVEAELVEAFQHVGDDGLIFIDFGWKDLDRYATVLAAAESVGRQLVVDGRLAYLQRQLHGRSVYEDGASVLVPPADSMVYSPSDYTRSKYQLTDIGTDEWVKDGTEPKHLVEGMTIPDIAAEQNQFIVQLGFSDLRHLPNFNPRDGSIYVRSSAEPFTEEMKLSHERIQQWLAQYNLNGENDHNPYQVHSSGHASRPELHSLIEAVQPKTLIPVHTNSPEKFKNPAGEVIVVSNGDRVNLDNL